MPNHSFSGSSSITQYRYAHHAWRYVLVMLLGYGLVIPNSFAQNPSVQTNIQPSQTTIANANITDHTTSSSPNQTHFTLNQPIIDQAQILSESQKQQLTAKIQDLYQRNLAQIAIVIVNSTQGEPIFDYSFRIAEQWKLGKKGIDNGLLIVVAVQDRKAYILTGYGLEGTIPDSIASRIIREDMAGHFYQGDYFSGFNQALQRIEQRLTSDPDLLAQADAQTKMQSQQQEQGSPLGFLFILVFFVGPMLYSMLGRFLGATVFAGATFAMSLILGYSLWVGLILAVLIWFLLFVLHFDRLFTFLLQNRGTNIGHHGHRPMGGGFGGSFGGGYSGGGGGFGGGGAGGSW